MTANDQLKTLEKPSAFSLCMNFLPFLHIASGALIAAFATEGTWIRLGVATCWLYLLPPLLARLLISVFGVPEGRLTQESSAYRVWWVLTQLQTIFNRIPLLEEVLRLVPGLYAAWIKIWGGQLSPLAYVAPGVTITDRHAFRVERGAVLGFGSTLAGHMAVRDETGRWIVVVASPVVEAEAILGGFAGLGPGATLKAGSVLPTGRRVGPFDTWPRKSSEQR